MGDGDGAIAFINEEELASGGSDEGLSLDVRCDSSGQASGDNFVAGVKGPGEVACLEELTANNPSFDKDAEDAANLAIQRLPVAVPEHCGAVE